MYGGRIRPIRLIDAIGSELFCRISNSLNLNSIILPLSINGTIACKDLGIWPNLEIACQPKKGTSTTIRLTHGVGFTFADLLAGDYTLSVTDKITKGILRFQNVHLTSESDENVTINLSGTTVKGSVRLGGKPYRNSPFSLKGDNISCLVVTDDMGNYTAKYIMHGKYGATFINPDTAAKERQIQSEIDVPESAVDFEHNFEL